MDLGISGLASGFDWRSLLDQLEEVERAPQQRLLVEQYQIEQQSTSYGSLKTGLNVLQNRVEILADPELYYRRATSVDSTGDDEIGTATAANGSTIGSYTFDIYQLVSASVRQGVTNIGAAINPTNDVSALVLGDAGFSRAITAGKFSVNGESVTISTTDSLHDVFDKISTATSGAVSESYDSTTDRISLSGAGKIVMGGGTNTSNGGGPLVSNSNPITESSSGITGLSVSALKVGSVIDRVKGDKDVVKDAIDQFLDGYNKVQALIEKETSGTTDDKGKVTAGALAGQPNANEIAGKLRAMAFGAVAGLSGTIERLVSFGIDTNGNNNNLSLSDAGLLDDALLNNMTSVAEMFTNESNGFAVQFETYLEKLAGDDGELDTRIENLANWSTSIDDNITEMEHRVQANREQMISRFVLMETAHANINQQLAQLQQNLAGIGA